MILDTNAVSALADGSRELVHALAKVTRLSLPAIVLGEYRYGIARSRHAARYGAWLGELVRVSDVLEVDEHTAEHYAVIRAELRSQGTPIPANDAWIASLARQHDLAVVSRDTHFDHVPKLTRQSW